MNKGVTVTADLSKVVRAPLDIFADLGHKLRTV